MNVLATSTSETAHLKSLELYVPHLVRRGIARDPRPLRAARRERFPAAVLFADICGFTALGQRLARQGDRGAERLQELLNECFGRLIELIAEHGGEVVKFAGDATLALWPVESEDDLAAAVGRAAQCGLRAERALEGLEPETGKRFRLRVAMSCGEVQALSVGGFEGRWELVVVGPPLTRLGPLLSATRPGETTLTPEARELAGDALRARPAEGGGAVLEAVTRPANPAPRLEPSLSPASQSALRSFIPPVILSRIDAGQASLLGEFRRTSVVFLSLGFPEADPNDLLGPLQRATRALQEIIERFGGCLSQLMADDKGTTLIVGWGMAHHTYEDSPERAVSMAVEACETLPGMGFTVRVGVATGRVFSGLRGNSRRREFALIGDTINRAARLMQGAGDRPLCDERTFRAARRRIRFEALPPRSFKGQERPLALYRPIGEQPVRIPRGPEPVGRRVERQTLAEALDRQGGSGEGGLLVIEGEAGLGKSVLLAEMAERAQDLGHRALVVVGDKLDHSTAYLPWRPLFSRLTGVEDSGDGDRQRRRILEGLPAALRLRAPLLDAVLPLSWPENETTREMTAEARASSTLDLLLHLFREAREDGPTLLVLEDAHWFDSASWALAEAVHRDTPGLLTVLATRPLDPETLSPEARRLLRSEGSRTLYLAPFSRDEVSALVKTRLDAHGLHPLVERLIHERAEGHPFFSEELALALRDRGLVEVVDGYCRLRCTEAELEGLSFPGTVEGVVASRIDHLPPEHQLTLKLAGVIGRTFDLDTLRAIHPLAAGPEALREQIGDMERLGLLAPSEPSDPSLRFRHVITQEVTYGLLTFDQRRRFHRAVAEWAEDQPGDDAGQWARLAHHWRGAEEPTRAIPYFARAGDHALAAYANREAARSFEEAVRLERETADPRDPETRRRLARFELALARAYSAASRYEPSRPHFETALDLMELPVPRGSLSCGLGLAGQALQQARIRLLPATLAAAGDSRRLQAAAKAYEGLSEVYYYSNEPALALYATVRGLNLAEAGGDSAQLARSYALAGSLAGFLPLHRLAELYCRRAETVVETRGTPADVLWVSLVLGVYATNIGDWSRADRRYTRTRELAERLGDRRRWCDATGNLADVHYFRGDYPEARRGMQAVVEDATRRNDIRYLMAGLRALAMTHLALGDLEPADRVLTEGAARAAQGLEAEAELTEIDFRCLGAVLAFRRGRVAAALDLARRGLDLFEKASATVSFYRTLVSCTAVADVCLEGWERARLHGEDEDEHHEDCRRALRVLGRFERVFPIARPAAHRCRGRIERLRGRPSRSLRALRRGRERARRLGMPLEEGLAELELGRNPELSGEDRRRHLERSRATFERLGARPWAERATMLLEAS